MDNQPRYPNPKWGQRGRFNHFRPTRGFRPKASEQERRQYYMNNIIVDVPNDRSPQRQPSDPSQLKRPRTEDYFRGVEPFAFAFPESRVSEEPPPPYSTSETTAWKENVGVKEEPGTEQTCSGSKSPEPTRGSKKLNGSSITSRLASLIDLDKLSSDMFECPTTKNPVSPLFLKPEAEERLKKIAETLRPLNISSKSIPAVTAELFWSGREDVKPLETMPNLPEVNMLLFHQWDNTVSNTNFQKNLERRNQMPVFKYWATILKTISNSQTTIISGNYQIGKSSQIPQYILDHFLFEGKGSQCRIISVLPSPLAVVAMAHWVSKQREECLGNTIGYQLLEDEVALSSSTPSRICCRPYGSLDFCTPKVLLSLLSQDRFLKTCSHVFLDEMQWGSVETEILLMALKELILVRVDLKLVVMGSAFDVQSLSRQLGNASIIEINSPSNLVNTSGPGQVAELLGHAEELPEDMSTMTELVAYLESSTNQGSILVFLEDCLQVQLVAGQQHLNSEGNLEVVLLHSRLPLQQQLEAVAAAASPDSPRKLILTHHSMAVGVNFPDVSYVIDAAPEEDFAAISRSELDQRATRAVRYDQEGWHYIIHQTRNTAEFAQCGFSRQSKSTICLLTLRYLPLEAFKSLMKPNDIEEGLSKLRAIGAVNQDEVTMLGYFLSRMEAYNPYQAKMAVMGALLKCLAPLLTVAASLEYGQDLFEMGNASDKKRKRKIFADGTYSDHYVYINIYRGWERAVQRNYAPQFLKDNNLCEEVLLAMRERRQLLAHRLCQLNFLSTADIANPAYNSNSDEEWLVKMVICAALGPDHMARVVKDNESDGLRFELANGCNVVGLSSLSVNCKEPQLPGELLAVTLVRIAEEKSGIYLANTTVADPSCLLFNPPCPALPVYCSDSTLPTNMRVTLETACWAKK